MPRIPVYESQVPTPSNVPRLDVYRAPEVYDTSGGLRDVAKVATDVMQKENQRRDTLSLMEFDQRLAELDQRQLLGDDQNPGGLRRMGRNAAGVTNQTLSSWDKEADTLMPKRLSPEAMAEAARRRSVRRQDAFERLTNHEYSQGQVADTEVTNSTLQTYANEALGSADDPKTVEANLARGRDALFAHGKRMGWDAQVTIQKTADWESGTIRSVIASQLTRDPLAALATFKAKADHLAGGDRLAIETALKPYVLDAQGRALGGSLYQGGVPTVAAGTPSLYDAIALTESGGRQFDATGAVIRGPVTATGARAVGKFQIMPATGPEAAALAGLPWDAKKFENDEVYHAQLGRAYIDAQVERFGGNVAAVAAAYNMGPEAAAAWVAGQPYKTASGKQWTPKGPMDMANLPAETRDYIGKVVGRMGGEPATAAATMANPQDAVDHSEAAALARAYKIENPDERDAAMQDIRLRASIDRMALSERERSAQAGKAALNDRYTNTVAKLADGVVVPLAERPSREQLVQAFGDIEGNQRYSEMQTYARLGPDVMRLRTATTAEAAGILDSYAPKPDSADYAFDRKIADHMASSWKAVQTARNDDPAAFLVQSSPTVATQFTALQQAQQDWANAAPEDKVATFKAMQARGQAYAGFLMSEQERLGVPANQRALLPKSVAQSLNVNFEASLAKGDVAGAVSQLRGAVAMFGDAGIQVIPQLGKEASPIARFALEGLDLRTIETLAKVSVEGEDVIKKAVGDNWKPLEEGVRAQLAAFDATGSTEYPVYYDATLKIAAAKTRAGMDPQAAAVQAASETINGRYDFGGNGSQIHYRVPRADVQGKPIDTEAVKRGASSTLATLKPTDISIGDQIPTGIKTDEFKEWRVRRIQRTGRWLNNGDESGLLLAYMDDSGRLVTVRGADGKPVMRSWDQLATIPSPSSSSFGYYGQSRAH